MSMESSKPPESINSILNTANAKLAPLQDPKEPKQSEIDSLTNFLKETNIVFTKLSDYNIDPDADIDEKLKIQILNMILNILQQDRRVQDKNLSTWRTFSSIR